MMTFFKFLKNWTLRSFLLFLLPYGSVPISGCPVNKSDASLALLLFEFLLKINNDIKSVKVDIFFWNSCVRWCVCKRASSCGNQPLIEAETISEEPHYVQPGHHTCKSSHRLIDWIRQTHVSSPVTHGVTAPPGSSCRVWCSRYDTGEAAALSVVSHHRAGLRRLQVELERLRHDGATRAGRRSDAAPDKLVTVYLTNQWKIKVFIKETPQCGTTVSQRSSFYISAHFKLI